MSAPDSASASIGVGVVLGGGPHHRGLAEPFLARVDVGAARREQLAPPRRCRCAPRSSAPARLRRSACSALGAGLQQRVERRGAAVGRGQRERRDAVAVGGLRVRRRRAAAASTSSMSLPRTAQCSAVVPSASGGVDVGALPRSSVAHRFAVAALRRRRRASRTARAGVETWPRVTRAMPDAPRDASTARHSRVPALDDSQRERRRC